MAKNEKQSRLTEIYLAQKAKGGGLGSALSERAKEKFDPRQMFNQKGLLAAVLPSLFKAYKSPTSSAAGASSATKVSGGGSVNMVALEGKMDFLIEETKAVRINTKMVAKNSLVMPMMARDMNLMRQNIFKLVKKQTGTASNKADMFFKNAAEREKDYESKFNKDQKNTMKSPGGGETQSGKTGGGGLMGGLMGSLGKGLGIATMGVGIGGFLAGIGAGAWALNQMGGAEGIKNVLVNLAEGLNAFNGQSLVALGALLGTGMLFGAVTGAGGAGGAVLGITAIGLGLAGFMTALSAGGALSDMIGGASGMKDFLVNLAEGLNAFGTVDAGNLAKLALAIPAFGLGMLAFFGMKGIGGIVQSIGEGMKGVLDFIFGNGNNKSPMQQLSDDLKLFENVNGDNLSKVGKGLNDLASGMSTLAKMSKADIANASSAAASGAKLAGAIGSVPAGAASAPSTSPNKTSETMTRLGISSNPSAGGGRGSAEAANVSPTKGGSAVSGNIPSDNSMGIDYNSYASALAKKESGGDYGAVNSLGYVGKYQFGAMALEDMGLVKKGVGKKGQKALDDPSNWNVEGGKQAFLGNAQLQEDTMLRYTQQNFKALARLGVITKDTDPKEVAGYLAAAHLLGPGGARDLKQGKSGTDAYGTSSAAYYKVGAETQTAGGGAGTLTASASPAAPAMSSPAPASGGAIASGTTQVAEAKEATQTAAPSITNVTNNNVSGGGSQGGGSQMATASVYDDLFATLVQRALA